MYNFCKRGQRSIEERNIGLEYALLVASNSHILTTLSHALWKDVNDSKSYVLALPMIKSVKILKYCFSGKNKFFFYLLACGNKIANRKKICFFFFRNLEPHNSRPSSQEKWWFVAGLCLIWKLMEYTNDHNPDASINFSNWCYSKFLMKKLHLSRLVPIFYERNILVFSISNHVTKGLTLKIV